MTDRKLNPVSREALVQAIQHGMLFDGRKRSHSWDKINAQVAAEKLADYLERANFVVMRAPPLAPHTADTRFKPDE
jgi:hypothetical protein